MSKYLYKIPNESYKNQKNKLRLHSYNFKIYGRDTTSKGDKVYRYKIKDRSVFTIFKKNWINYYYLPI